MMIHPVINGFPPNEVTSNLHIFGNLMITFGRRGLFLGFSNISSLDILDRFKNKWLIKSILIKGFML